MYRFRKGVVSLVICFFCLFLLPVQAQYNDRDPCGYSTEQLETIEKASDLFLEHGDTHVVKKYVDGTDFEGLVAGLNEELIQTFEEILDVCRDGQLELYTYQQPMSMAELAPQVREYRNAIQALDAFADENNVQNSTIHDGMIALQDHLLGDFIAQFTEMKFVKKNTNMRVEFVFEHREGDVDGSFTLLAAEKASTDATQAHSMVEIDVEVDAETREEKYAFKGAMGVEVLLVDGNMYLKLDDSSLRINESSLTDEQLQSWNEMRTTLQLIEGKWIDLMSSVPGGNDLLLQNMDAISYVQDIQEMLASPWLMLYYQENGSSYAGIDPRACLTVGSFAAIRTCVTEMWLPSWQETDGKGFIKLSEDNGVYSLAMTDTFSKEKLPQEMQQLRDHTLLTRNKSEILSFSLPMGDMGYLSYKDNAIDGKITVPYESYDDISGTFVSVPVTIDIDGRADNNGFTINGSLISNDMRGSMRFSSVGDINDMAIESDIRIINEGTDAFDLGLNIYLATTQDELASLSLQAPSPDDIVDLSVFNN